MNWRFEALFSHGLPKEHRIQTLTLLDQANGSAVLLLEFVSGAQATRGKASRVSAPRCSVMGVRCRSSGR